MAESAYHCSCSQGFNFEKDAQVTVGHLKYLKIGEQEYSADIAVTDPENVTETVKVVGVLTQIYWAGGYADPVQLSAQVSTANKNLLATLVHTSLSNTEVMFEFVTYDYDPEKHKYYKCFHSNDEQLKGLIHKSGGSLEIDMATEENHEVVSPKNFALTIGIMPQDQDQAIHIAVSTDGKFAKKWGIAVSA